MTKGKNQHVVPIGANGPLRALVMINTQKSPLPKKKL